VVSKNIVCLAFVGSSAVISAWMLSHKSQRSSCCREFSAACVPIGLLLLLLLLRPMCAGV
jgi:hypothetical protein